MFPFATLLFSSLMSCSLMPSFDGLFFGDLRGLFLGLNFFLSKGGGGGGGGGGGFVAGGGGGFKTAT